MNLFCHACGIPLNMSENKSRVDHYCQNCINDQNEVKSRAEVQNGLAQWFLTWQPGIDLDTALVRADHYLKAMPHWAEPGVCEIQPL